MASPAAPPKVRLEPRTSFPSSTRLEFCQGMKSHQRSFTDKGRANFSLSSWFLLRGLPFNFLPTDLWVGHWMLSKPFKVLRLSWAPRGQELRKLRWQRRRREDEDLRRLRVSFCHPWAKAQLQMDGARRSQRRPYLEREMAAHERLDQIRRNVLSRHHLCGGIISVSSALGRPQPKAWVVLSTPFLAQQGQINTDSEEGNGGLQDWREGFRKTGWRNGDV